MVCSMMFVLVMLFSLHASCITHWLHWLLSMGKTPYMFSLSQAALLARTASWWFPGTPSSRFLSEKQNFESLWMVDYSTDSVSLRFALIFCLLTFLTFTSLSWEHQFLWFAFQLRLPFPKFPFAWRMMRATSALQNLLPGLHLQWRMILEIIFWSIA